MQNKGYDKKPAAEAALEAVKAYRSVEHYFGVPPDRILKMPKDAADEAGWNTVYEKLGAPKEAKAYDESLKGIKFADGTELEPAFVDKVKAVALKNHLSPGAAAAMVKEIVANVDAADAGSAQENEQIAAVEARKLNDAWGSNREVNAVIAKNAASKLGPEYLEAAQALEGKVGYAMTMKLFHMMGQLMGEDKFVRQAGGDGAGGLTKEQATLRKNELMKDPDWVKKYQAGGAAENREFKNLLEIILA